MKLLKSTLVIVALATMATMDAKQEPVTTAPAAPAKKAPAAPAKSSAAQTHLTLRNSIKTRKDVMDRGLLSKTFIKDMTSKASAAEMDVDLYKNLLQTGRDMHAHFPTDNAEALQILTSINGQIEEAVAAYAEEE